MLLHIIAKTPSNPPFEPFLIIEKKNLNRNSVTICEHTADPVHHVHTCSRSCRRFAVNRLCNQ